MIGNSLSRRGFLAASGISLMHWPVPLSGTPQVRIAKQKPKTRRIWLNRLLRAVQQKHQDKQSLSDQERHFAGLTRIKFIYVDADSRDIILEGPAEDQWKRSQTGMMVGAVSGRPLLNLDDFCVAARNTFSHSPAPFVSLEPRRESMDRVRQFIKSAAHPKTDADRTAYERKIQQAWRDQDTVTSGVARETNFMKVMLDADWEMKRVSLGHSNSGVEKFKSYADLEFNAFCDRVVKQKGRARKPSTRSRFWFYPAYDNFLRTPNSDTFGIPTRAVQLLTERSFRRNGGDLEVAPNPSPAAKEFVDEFTQRYNDFDLANPLYAYLRNLFDWVAISKILQQIDAPQRSDINFGFLLETYAVPKIETPSTMPGLVALKHRRVNIDAGRAADLLFPIRGGVSIEMDHVLGSDNFIVDQRLVLQRSAAIRSRPMLGFWS